MSRRASGVGRVEIVERLATSRTVLDAIESLLADVATVHYAQGLLDAGREFVAELGLRLPAGCVPRSSAGRIESTGGAPRG